MHIKKLVRTKGYGVWATTIEGQNAFRSIAVLCAGKFHVTESQTTRDQINSR